MSVLPDDDDFFDFIEDEAEPAPPRRLAPWQIAVIDDDPAVHDGTRFALRDYVFQGRGVEILSAYSGREGFELLRTNPNVAVTFLDVVMEHDAAGLDLVPRIRNELGNTLTRIILRTGQPGQAPERRVVLDYDINDYKAKTELTEARLFTTLTAALRSFEHLKRIEDNRRGLELVVDAAANLNEGPSIARLADGILTQIANLLNADCDGVLMLRDFGCRRRGQRAIDSMMVLAATGLYQPMSGQSGKVLVGPLRDQMLLVLTTGKSIFSDRLSTLHIQTPAGREVIAAVSTKGQFQVPERVVLELFCSKLAIAIDNVALYDELAQANASLERRVAERTAELGRVNAIKSEVLGMVAHDLKNPLGVVLGRAEMIALEVETGRLDPQRITRYLEEIEAQSRRMLDLIGHLLTHAAQDATDVSISPAPMDLMDIVRATVNDYRPAAERKGQSITLDGPSNLPILGDVLRLREAVSNYVSNAVKYTGHGGVIHVTARVNGDLAVIEVSDSGPGLTLEDLHRVFGKFQRLSAHPTGGESATGLGLSIVKRIVELHGGTVAARSQGRDRGATFTMRLPRQ